MITVISVRFRSGCKTYYFDPKGTLVRTGDDVIVETSQGLEFARCTEGNHHVTDDQVVHPLRALVRIATDNDRRVNEANRRREAEAFQVCQKKILQHKLEMKLVRVECGFEGGKILFFFTADGRVDFRELVKDLAGVFHSRIELRQIGVRDEAKMLGGLGICGRPFCCSQFMDDFMPVSIKMAKTQNLSLNPAKISGTCGRLMCCLKYEQCAYEDALKRLPKNDSFVLTPDGPGNVTEVNVLREQVTVRLDDRTENPCKYHNCEVCVLRNGKGSRDGIEIPRERPERFVEEKEEELPIPTFFSDFDPDRAPEPQAPDQRSGSSERRRPSRRSRGGQRKGDGSSAQRSERRSDGGKPQAPKAKAPRPEGGENKGGENKSRSSRRRKSGPRPQNQGQAQNPPRSNPPKNRDAGAPRPEGGEQRRRPHRRGGRRHSSGGSNGSGGSSGTPKAES